jgi:hypothetical protein
MEIPSMSFRKALVIFLGLGTACAAAGCSSSSPGTDGSGGSTGGGGAPSCDGIDFAAYSTPPIPSFKTDIMPIFGLSCTASDCHNSHDKKAGLDLGWKCDYMAATKTCVFPAMVDPNTMSANPSKPLTQAVLDAVHASLMAQATTVIPPSASVPRVIPNNAEHSFLIEKVSDTQNKQGYTCKNQDPSHETAPKACGESMPLPQGSEPLCSGTNRPRFDLLARWIAQGAPNN